MRFLLVRADNLVLPFRRELWCGCFTPSACVYSSALTNGWVLAVIRQNGAMGFGGR
jgi:hypothetical protein